MKKVILLMLSLITTISYAGEMQFCEVKNTGTVRNCYDDLAGCEANKWSDEVCVARPKAK